MKVRQHKKEAHARFFFMHIYAHGNSMEMCQHALTDDPHTNRGRQRFPYSMIHVHIQKPHLLMIKHAQQHRNADILCIHAFS